MTWGLGLGWLAALAAAIAVGLWSFAVGNEVRSPAISMAVPLHSYSTGTAGGGVALSLYSARLVQDPAAKVGSAERKLSWQAYRADPLAVSSLAIMALSMGDQAEQARRRSLLELTGKLSRRSNLINYELIKDAGLRNDDRAFFAWLSRSVLTNNEARTGYLTIMAEATARDGAVAALAPVIGPQPSWAETYWRAVLGKPASLANAARLRIAVARPPWKQTDITEADKQLVQQLVRGREFELAQQLAAALPRSGASRAGAANLLGTENLARQPELPPFDWQLAVQGNLGASIDDAGQSLAISAIAGARGAAARRLLPLMPGDYVLGWTLSSNGEIAPNALTAWIECGERNDDANPPPVALTVGSGKAGFAIADNACRWHWLSVQVDMPDDAAGIDARLSDISLVRTGA